MIDQQDHDKVFKPKNNTTVKMDGFLWLDWEEEVEKYKKKYEAAKKNSQDVEDENHRLQIQIQNEKNKTKQYYIVQKACRDLHAQLQEKNEIIQTLKDGVLKWNALAEQRNKTIEILNHRIQNPGWATKFEI